jgi:hypothetical protein
MLDDDIEARYIHWARARRNAHSANGTVAGLRLIFRGVPGKDLSIHREVARTLEAYADCLGRLIETTEAVRANLPTPPSRAR